MKEAEPVGRIQLLGPVEREAADHERYAGAETTAQKVECRRPAQLRARKCITDQRVGPVLDRKSVV